MRLARRADRRPDGQITNDSNVPASGLSSLVRKNILFVRIFGLSYIASVPPHRKGRIMIVANAGRDAVDADGASDEGAGGGRAKSCGPDTPTLVSSLR
jgi:hypothetical protein